MSIIGGVVAGILGFTGLKGFVLYFLLMAFTSLGLIAKAKFSIDSYFDSWNRPVLDGFLGGLMVQFLVISFSQHDFVLDFFFLFFFSEEELCSTRRIDKYPTVLKKIKNTN